ncbi:MAG TPA: hypothetical protein VER76_07025 [Pyrinomonadaceae bacterium]|nr:hypothetical protein [Pyrinomonadaceae bacterium]
MKRTPTVIKRLTIALALTAQLFILAPATQAVVQNTNSSTHADHDMGTMQRRPSRRNRCRERCQRQYRQCTRGIVNPNQARCRERYRRCLRTCRR